MRVLFVALINVALAALLVLLNTMSSEWVIVELPAVLALLKVTPPKNPIVLNVGLNAELLTMPCPFNVRGTPARV